MSALGQKRTLERLYTMSALPSKADMFDLITPKLPHIRKLAMLPRCITLGWRVRLARCPQGGTRENPKPVQTAMVMASLKRVRTMSGNVQRAAAVVSCLMTMMMKK